MKNIVEKIRQYWESPWLITHDLKNFYHKQKYFLLCLIDPPPLQKKGELTDDYFERVDPKYGLRFYRELINIGTPIDLEYSLTMVNETYKDKKARKLMRDFLIALADVQQKNIENYKKYLIRNEVLKNS